MNASALRVLDANANRAREALRVIEDYARFVLDHDELSASLKSLRHELTTATKPWLSEAILWRDTPGDVGTDNKTPAEFDRQGLADVLTAAGKRLGEALRVIEEFAKTIDVESAAQVESIRYRFYTIEQTVARTLRPANRFDRVWLYVLITESACSGPWFEAAQAAIAGGADCLQLREKSLEGAELLSRAKRLVGLCRHHGVLSIINDRADVAVLSGADGVHVGQGDLPATEARRIVGSAGIVGVSTHEIAQAKQAVLDGADYIGVGPIFPSPTKPRDFLPGLALGKQVAEQIRIPAIAIAGITDANVDEVLATGIARIAVTAAVAGCADVKSAAERLKARLVRQAVGDPGPVGQAFLPVLDGGPVGQAFLPVVDGGPVGQAFLPVVDGGTPSSTRKDKGQADEYIRPWQARMPAPPEQRPASPEQRPAPPEQRPASPEQRPAPPELRPAPSTDLPAAEPQLRIHRRRLPHWQLQGSTYFLTFRVALGELSMPERLIVLQHVGSGDGKFYDLLAAVVMPDHAHAVVTPHDGIDLPRIMKGIKGVSAKLVNDHRGTRGQLWQDESFDRIIRDSAELAEKLEYLITNPNKAGLVEDPWTYEALYVSQRAGEQ